MEFVLLLAEFGCFLHLDSIKKFERATMTRIGRYQFCLPDFTGNASYRRDNLAPLKILPDQTASINISVPMLPGRRVEVHTGTARDSQALFLKWLEVVPDESLEACPVRKTS